MEKTIEITIKDKIAKHTNKTLYVCGNSDFVVNFVFDEEWNECSVKTARFIHSAGYTDVVFEGNQCPVPIISNTHNIYVGVFAGNLLTTTPAYISAKKSILCDSGSPVAPTDDVYAQIMELINSGCGGSGEAGKDGQDGISCTHEWKGTVLTITSASGTSSADLKGEPGKPGDPGEPGHTPQKGVDYWTETDKQGIVDAVLAALPTAEGGSF